MSTRLRFQLPVLSIISLMAFGCQPPPPGPHPDRATETTPEPEVDYRWLSGSDAEKLKAIEEQLGGFSVTMTEVGYRYVELHWAGQDQNWDFASYQLEHIGEAIEAGILRRPGRAESARPFLDESIPAMQAAIEAQDPDRFAAQFATFQTACNTCHVEEDVAFIQIARPTSRASSVHFNR